MSCIRPPDSRRPPSTMYYVFVASVVTAVCVVAGGWVTTTRRGGDVWASLRRRFADPVPRQQRGQAPWARLPSAPPPELLRALQADGGVASLQRLGLLLPPTQATRVGLQPWCDFAAVSPPAHPGVYGHQARLPHGANGEVVSTLSSFGACQRLDEPQGRRQPDATTSPRPEVASPSLSGDLLSLPAPGCWCSGSDATWRVEAALAKAADVAQAEKLAVGFSPKALLRYHTRVKHAVADRLPDHESPGSPTAEGVPLRAVFKPGTDGARELLVYRIAQTLGLCFVPPVVPLTLPGELVAQHLLQHRRHRQRVRKATLPDGRVYGAAVLWVDGVARFNSLAEWLHSYGAMNASRLAGLASTARARTAASSPAAEWTAVTHPQAPRVPTRTLTAVSQPPEHEMSRADPFLSAPTPAYPPPPPQPRLGEVLEAVGDLALLDLITSQGDRNRNLHAGRGGCGALVVMDNVATFAPRSVAAGWDPDQLWTPLPYVRLKRPDPLSPFPTSATCRFRGRTLLRLVELVNQPIPAGWAGDEEEAPSRRRGHVMQGRTGGFDAVVSDALRGHDLAGQGGVPAPAATDDGNPIVSELQKALRAGYVQLRHRGVLALRYVAFLTPTWVVSKCLMRLVCDWLMQIR